MANVKKVGKTMIRQRPRAKTGFVPRRRKDQGEKFDAIVKMCVTPKQKRDILNAVDELKTETSTWLREIVMPVVDRVLAEAEEKKHARRSDALHVPNQGPKKS